MTQSTSTLSVNQHALGVTPFFISQRIDTIWTKQFWVRLRGPRPFRLMLKGFLVIPVLHVRVDVTSRDIRNSKFRLTQNWGRHMIYDDFSESLWAPADVPYTQVYIRHWVLYNLLTSVGGHLAVRPARLQSLNGRPFGFLFLLSCDIRCHFFTVS